MYNSFCKLAAIIASVVVCNAPSAQCFETTRQGLWGLVEVFSNADGSVQFMVLASAKGDGMLR